MKHPRTKLGLLLLVSLSLHGCGDFTPKKDCYPNNGGCIGPQQDAPPAADDQPAK